MAKTNGSPKAGKKETRPPAIAPPGHIRQHGHGLQSGPRQELVGVEHLRNVLRLSADADVERICEDAANEIEQLREQAPPIPWPEKR